VLTLKDASYRLRGRGIGSLPSTRTQQQIEQHDRWPHFRAVATATDSAVAYTVRHGPEQPAPSALAIRKYTEVPFRSVPVPARGFIRSRRSMLGQMRHTAESEGHRSDWRRISLPRLWRI
jgi:hypothetical protein